MTIADIMIEILHEKDKCHIWYGDLTEIHECAKRAGLYDRPGNTHPIAINNRVLSALERSGKFEKGYIKDMGRPARSFTLRPEYRKG